MRAWRTARRALAAWVLMLALNNMTDRNTSSPGSNLVNKLLQMIFCLTATTTYTPGTGGGSAFTVTPPFFVRLMTVQGSNTANGTELSATGYTAGGATMGSPAYGTPAGGIIASANAVSWTAGAAWSPVVAIETFDSAATKLRYQQGSITSVTLGNGNTLTFPAGSITGDGSTW
jgi:hypothetical protein